MSNSSGHNWAAMAGNVGLHLYIPPSSTRGVQGCNETNMTSDRWPLLMLGKLKRTN